MAVPLDLNHLRSAPWLKTTAIRRVFDALAATGATSRAVGGAVRNTLLGLPIDDVDIATTATPESVLAAAAKAGLAAIPTGLQHGTVTLVSEGVHVEVTTLRRDVTTDGRHATVAFTDDWAVDAGRRDFTINALYCDADGTLFDPLGGVADLAPPRIRFIGDARARIREDYLRILRFFRFSARYGVGPVDPLGLQACSAERDGLTRVSAERIRVELLKLLTTPRAAEMARIMQSHGFLVAMLGCAPAPSRLARLAALEVATGATADPIRRLAGLALYPCADVAQLARRLRLSGAERDRLKTITATWAHVLAATSPADTRRCIYRHGADGCRDALIVGWAGSMASLDDTQWLQRFEIAAIWKAPAMPIDGQDVVALGIEPGPSVGRYLRNVEAWWLAADFAPDREACLAQLAGLVRPS